MKILVYIPKYLPFPFQRRLIAGIQFPIAILAACFLARARSNLIAGLVILAIASGSAMMMAGQVRDIRSSGMPFYLPLQPLQ